MRKAEQAHKRVCSDAHFLPVMTGKFSKTSTDFYEVEIARQEFRFGDIAHVLSAYEARTAPAPAGKVLRRGVNSIQLMHDGERWWILSTIWDNEREGVTLPPELV